MNRPDPAPPDRRGAVAVALGSLILTFLVRISNLSTAFVNGVPQLSPYDELYHAKRLVYSSERPLRVLDFDPMRGPRGLFCPWPPLYDMAGGLVARAAGGRGAVGVVSRASGFPPVVSALAAALVAGVVARRFGAGAGLLTGAGIALATFHLDRSRLGSIDHHFLELPLVLAIVAATAYLLRAEARDVRSVMRSGALLGLALATALLVQTALLLAGAVALAVVLAADASRVGGRWSAAAGFLLASVIVAVYGGTKPAGYPVNEWYLGLPHAAALLAAAAACAVQAMLLRRGAGIVPSALAAGGVGVLALTSAPGALEAFLEGTRFLGGNPWLESILEFQPLFRQNAPFWVDLCLLGGGVFVTAAAAATRGWRRGGRLVLLAFALAYSLAAVTSRRFLAISTPLTAISGAIAIADWSRARRAGPALATAGGLVLLAPSALLTAGQVVRPPSPVTQDMVPALAAAEYLRSRTDAPGRVLPPWSFGHLVDVVGGRGVLIDNFGTAGGRTEFEASTAITLATREDRVADHCSDRGARFVILQDPLPYYADHARMSGLPRGAYQRIGPGGPAPTRLMTASFWWRAYFEGGRERPDLGPAGGAFRRFRLARTAISPEKSDVRSAVQVWELVRP